MSNRINNEGKWEAYEQHPNDYRIFGPIGVHAVLVFDLLSGEFKGKTFGFMHIEQFKLLPVESSNEIYWSELLYRAYWTAAVALQKHKRWQEGCTRACLPSVNFFGFAASLRGFYESCIDAAYTLRAVPSGLAGYAEDIIQCLRGKVSDHLLINEELEERLIHFPFARRIPKKAERQRAEPGFSALEPWEYRKDLDLEPEADALLSSLYDDLCGLCHPTASAAEWLYQTTPRQLIRLREGGDESKLDDFLQKHGPTIAIVAQIGFNSIMLALKTLNYFPVAEVQCAKAERFDMTHVDLWAQAQPLLEKALTAIYGGNGK